MPCWPYGVTVFSAQKLPNRRLTVYTTIALELAVSALQSVFGRSHARHKLTGFLSHTTMYFLALAYTAALCINLFGCVFYFTARVEGISNGNTWLSAVGALKALPGDGLVRLGSTAVQSTGCRCCRACLLMHNPKHGR